MSFIAGGQKERINILRLVKTRTASGSIEETYILFKKLSADIGYKTSREQEINNQLTALNIIKIKIRYRTDLDETMVVELAGEKYDIRYIEHNKRADTFITAERAKL